MIPENSPAFEAVDGMTGEEAFYEGLNKLENQPSEADKLSVTLFLDTDIVRFYQQKGEDWQAEINDALRKCVEDERQRD